MKLPQSVFSIQNYAILGLYFVRIYINHVHLLILIVNNYYYS